MAALAAMHSFRKRIWNKPDAEKADTRVVEFVNGSAFQNATVNKYDIHIRAEQNMYHNCNEMKCRKIHYFIRLYNSVVKQINNKQIEQEFRQ